MKNNHVAHKYREPTLFNDQMQEVYNCLRSQTAVWRKMCREGLTLRLRPLRWESKEFGNRWLMEMSFTDHNGHPARTKSIERNGKR